MAYLGMVGPYATGKSTAMDKVLDWLEYNHSRLDHNVMCVDCDRNLERGWCDGES